MNVIIVRSFRTSNGTKFEEYINTIEKFFKQINKNDYPIVVVMKRNYGGNVHLSQCLLKN